MTDESDIRARVAVVVEKRKEIKKQTARLDLDMAHIQLDCLHPNVDHGNGYDRMGYPEPSECKDCGKRL
mgnify:CR=1 FL=1